MISDLETIEYIDSTWILFSQHLILYFISHDIFLNQVADWEASIVDSILLSTPYQGVKKICEQAGRAIRVIRAYPRLADMQVRGGEGAGEAEGYTVDVSCKTGGSLMSERWLYRVPKIAACEEVDVSCNGCDSLLALVPDGSYG